MEMLEYVGGHHMQVPFRKTAAIARSIASGLAPWIFLGSLLLLGQSDASGQIGGATSIGPPRTTPGPHWWDFVYSPAFPPEARRALVPLYQRMDDISQQIVIGRRMNAQEIADAILGALGGAAESKATGVVRQSATGRPPGSSPPDAPPSFEDLSALLLDLRSTGFRIAEIRRQYNVEATIGPAPKPFDPSRAFQPDPAQIKKWIAEVQSGAPAPHPTPPPDTDKPTDSTTGQTFNPNALTPAEQAARQQNEQIVANETLKPSSQGSTRPLTGERPSSIEGSWTVASSSNSCGSGGPSGYRIVRQGLGTYAFAEGGPPIIETGPGKYAWHFRQPETSTDVGWATDMTLALVDNDTLQMDGQAQVIATQADSQPGPCILHFLLKRAK